MSELFGLKVVISPMLKSQPRMQLSPAIKEIVTPAFAADMDAWLLAFFGIEQSTIIIGNTAFVSEKAYARLIAQGHVHGLY